MAHDDDAGGFLGITYISHGKDHKKGQAEESRKPAVEEPAKKSRKPDTEKQAKREESAEIARLERELAAVESALQQYQSQTAERLDHLERLAGHPISPEEKVYRIQEDS